MYWILKKRLEVKTYLSVMVAIQIENQENQLKWSHMSIMASEIIGNSTIRLTILSGERQLKKASQRPVQKEYLCHNITLCSHFCLQLGTCSTCRPQEQECQLDRHCCPGLQCDKEGDVQFDGNCRAPRENGQQCWESSQCQSGNCDDSDFYPDSGECVPAEPWWRHNRKYNALSIFRGIVSTKNPQRTPRWSVICDFIVWTTFYPSSVRIVFIIATNWIAWYVGSLWHVPYHWPFPQPNDLPSITFGPFYRICALAWGHYDMQTLSTLLTLCRSTSLSLGDFLNKIQ